MDCAIVPLLNGFDPNNAEKVDEFSQKALKSSVRVYKEMKKHGRSVSFVIIKSVVRDESKKLIWFEVMRQETICAGVDPADIVLTDMETTGALSDGLALSRFSKKHPEAVLCMVATAPCVLPYFRATYKTVARVFDDNPQFDFILCNPEDHSKVSLKVRILYFALYVFTAVVSTGYTDFLFKLWFKFRNHHDQKRITGFVRTVE